MTEETRKKLEDVGIDLDSVLERFMGNEGLLERFLKKFPEDKSYQKLVEAVESRDVEAAFEAAHTLKGVSANLALENLHEVVDKQTELLRNKDMDAGAALMQEITKQYENTVAVIKEVYGI